jgi:hypothetical protein
MPGSLPWKELYLQAVFERDKGKMSELVLATEQAIGLRLQELLNSTDNKEERSEIAIVKASLLAIKIHKLGWPAV